MNLNSATKVASGTFDAAGNPITKAVNNSAGAINNALDSIAGIAKYNNAYSASQAQDLRSGKRNRIEKLWSSMQLRPQRIEIGKSICLIPPISVKSQI